MGLKNKPSIVIKGIKSKKMWAVFAPDGKLHFHTIANSEKMAKAKIVWALEESLWEWDDYAKEGYTTNKILVDIKLL